MGNLCVPQAPRELRASFRRKSSLQGKEKKWTYLFGNEIGQERVTSGEKILQYIPAKDIVAPEDHKENMDQKFLSIFRKGKKKTVVRNMGQMVHYSKVKFKFQHCQEVNDCYLELFQAHLYFQSRSPKGLTYQGLLPLKDLSIYKMETPSASQEEHAFRIAGPSLNPLIVYCASLQELQKWLYHLEKQIQLNGGGADPPFNVERPGSGSHVHTAELRWSVQNLPVQNWEGTQRESLGEVTYVSKVILQHLPFQEHHDRLLILYPETLVILSEEQSGLYFRGELPLKAIQVTAEEGPRPSRSFLIEGRLINTIRVTCSSTDDFQDWMDYIHSAKFQNSDSSCSGSEGFTRSRSAHYGQVSGSGRSSLASHGRSNSWTSGKKNTRHSHSSHGSHGSNGPVDRQSFAILNDPRLQLDPMSPGYAQPLQALGSSNWGSGGTPPPAPELKRGGSTRASKGRPGLHIQMPLQPTDLSRNCYDLILETPREDQLSPIYNEPYSSQDSRQPPATYHPECDDMKRWSLAESQYSTSSSISEKELPLRSNSPLYADPYTPNAQPSYPRFLDETVENQCQVSSEKANPRNKPFPMLPVSHPALQKKFSHPLLGNLPQEPLASHRYSEPAVSIQAPSCRDDILRPRWNTPGLSSDCKPCPVLTEHEYAELQGFNSDFPHSGDFSYDNVWDSEPQISRFSPGPCGRFNHPGAQDNKAKLMAHVWS
ncbi:pleckstrin homology domain-containing family N member 1 [Ambystoma mexicanum]|uniref:pleckstrin homology domain-containing family N member 1 n=1 Tax=Ambystoma mexicanum TaxID=8296 RepID=UPI0037E91ECF